MVLIDPKNVFVCVYVLKEIMSTCLVMRVIGIKVRLRPQDTKSV